MRRAAPVAGLLALLGGAASIAGGAVTLQVGVDTKVGAEVTAHVDVKNLGDEPALRLVPEAVLGDATGHGDGYESLTSGFSTAWDLVLARPAGLGAFPLVVELHYADVTGRAMSAPVVHEVRTTGTTRSPLTVSLEVPPVATRAVAIAHVQNRAEAPARGTLHLLPSGELLVRPAEQPLEVPADSTLHVPFEIENRSGYPDSTAALYAWVTTVEGDRHGLAIASSGVAIVEPEQDRRTPVVPLVVAAILTLGLGFALLRRWLAAPRLPQARAARRRRGG